MNPKNPTFDPNRRKFLGQCCAAVSATGMLSTLAQLRMMGAVASADNGGSVVIVDDVPSEALRRLAGTPLLRRERLELARQRLFAADRPSAEDIADRLVGRLVCDRLR